MQQRVPRWQRPKGRRTSGRRRGTREPNTLQRGVLPESQKAYSPSRGRTLCMILHELGHRHSCFIIIEACIVMLLLWVSLKGPGTLSNSLSMCRSLTAVHQFPASATYYIWNPTNAVEEHEEKHENALSQIDLGSWLTDTDMTCQKCLLKTQPRSIYTLKCI